MNDKAISWEAAVEWLRNQPDQQALVRSCFYDDPLSEAACRYHASTEWQAIREYLPSEKGTVLDLGAGRGIAAYAFAKDGWQVTALEPDPSLLVGAGAIEQLAAETHVAIDVVQNWGEQLPFTEAQFDVVHARQVLHHANDLTQLCQEIARVLKPNGLFIATREHVISRHEDLNRFLETHPLHRLYDGEHAYLLKEYTESIERAGLVISKVLNPMESDINLFPDTLTTLRAQFAKRLHIPNCLIPKAALSLYGWMMNTPGRLYSFVASKKA